MKLSSKKPAFSRKMSLSGRYYKTLFRTFISIALLLSALFIGVFLVAYAQVHENEQNAQQIFAQNRYNLVDTGVAVILNELSSFLRNPIIAEWADAQDSVTYYSKAAELYTHIKLSASQLGAISYEFAVAGERYETMTISGLGSGPAEWFFNEETMLSAEQITSIQKYSGNANSLLVVPVYKNTETGTVLRELYFIKQLPCKTQKIVVLLKVLANPVFLPEKDENFCLIGPHGIMVYGQNSAATEMLFSAYFKSGEGKELFSTTKNRYFSRFLNTFPWQLVSVYPRNNMLHIIIACILFSVTLGICFLLRYAAKKITGILYFPLNEVVLNSLTAKETSISENYDEFEILRGNSHKIALLSKELQEVVEQKKSLAEQKYYRGLIEGIIPQEDINDTNAYFVAQTQFAEIKELKERELYLWVQFVADAYAHSHSDVHYVQYGTNGFILLLQCASQETAKKTLKALFKKLHTELSDLELYTALSNVVYGKAHVRAAFLQTVKILEYRRSLPNQDILTANLITSPSNEFYYYPMSVEQKLLSLIINGSPQTGAYFDEITAENNALSLSPPAVQNLLFALAGTIARTLQELKTTPEKLYGKPIEWTDLYARIPSDAVFTQLRTIAVNIADSVRENTSQNDKKMLVLMEEYIHENFNQDIQLQDLANQFNITPKYCSKLFSRLSNDTFKNFLNSFRVRKAKEMIEKNPTVKIGDVSIAMGFNSANSFIRVFVKYTGVSPKTYADTVIEKISAKTEKLSS